MPGEELAGVRAVDHPGASNPQAPVQGRLSLLRELAVLARSAALLFPALPLLSALGSPPLRSAASTIFLMSLASARRLLSLMPRSPLLCGVQKKGLPFVSPFAFGVKGFSCKGAEMLLPGAIYTPRALGSCKRGSPHLSPAQPGGEKPKIFGKMRLSGAAARTSFDSRLSLRASSKMKPSQHLGPSARAS